MMLTFVKNKGIVKKADINEYVWILGWKKWNGFGKNEKVEWINHVNTSWESIWLTLKLNIFDID